MWLIPYSAGLLLLLALLYTIACVWSFHIAARYLEIDAWELNQCPDAWDWLERLYGTVIGGFIEKGQLLNFKALRFFEKLKTSGEAPVRQIDECITRIKEAISDTGCDREGWEMNVYFITNFNFKSEILNGWKIYEEAQAIANEGARFWRIYRFFNLFWTPVYKCCV